MGTIQEERNYDFLPLLAEKEEYNNYGEKIKGTLELEIEAYEDIHIGTGQYIQKDNRFAKECYKDIDGNACIPASSLKGAVRNISACVSKSCLDSADGKCLSRKKQEKRNRKENTPYRKIEKPCITCCTYGLDSYASRIIFSECKSTSSDFLIKKINQPYTPSKTEDGPKLYKNEVKNEEIEDNLEVEVMKKGTIFSCRLIIKEITIEQLKLLLFSLGLDESFEFKVGGFKGQGYGKVKIKAKAYNLSDSKGRKHIIQGSLKEFASTYYTECKDEKCTNVMNKMRTIMKPKVVEYEG
ncbi:RAMP superfamily CRISPR-associated protein [Anaerosporobacter sp.]|uniref:RAMP superfamily CRISPR-associated protein n=1 Tax=Anaerosporobacter sp. TaxID=1872529 RepID=UPI00286F3BEB|nr:RAMP superfamily CRISPR-associated protein [Anaerosporobacter sp.]